MVNCSGIHYDIIGKDDKTMKRKNERTCSQYKNVRHYSIEYKEKLHKTQPKKGTNMFILDIQR